jgi:hypothetical protein
VLGEIVNAPCSAGIKEQGLGSHAGLAGQAELPGRPGQAATVPCCLHVDQDPGELDVGVAQAVRDPDPVIGEDPPGLLARLLGHNQHRWSHRSLQAVNDAPRLGGVQPSLRLHPDREGSIPDVQLAPLGMLGTHTGEPAEDPEGPGSYRRLYVHSLRLIHRTSAYTMLSEAFAGRFAAAGRPTVRHSCENAKTPGRTA